MDQVLQNGDAIENGHPIENGDPGQVINQILAIVPMPPRVFHGICGANIGGLRPDFLGVSNNASGVVGGNMVEILVQSSYEGPFWSMTVETRTLANGNLASRVHSGWLQVATTFHIGEGDFCVFVKTPLHPNSFLLGVHPRVDPPPA